MRLHGLLGMRFDGEGRMAAGTLGLAVAVVLALAAVVWAPPARASLDPGFGDGGTVQLRPEVPGYRFQEVLGTAVGPGGAIYVLEAPARCSGNCTSTITDLILTRLRADGAVDTSFGEGGSTSISSFPHRPGAQVAVDSQGRAVVAVGERGGIVVVRLLKDGSRDPSFGSGGEAIDACNCFGGPTGLGVDGSNRVLVAGSYFSPLDKYYEDTGQDVVARFTEGGQLDGTFGNFGHALVSLPSSTSTAFAVSAAGRASLAAVGCCPQQQRLVVRQLSTSGIVNKRFGVAASAAIARIKARLDAFPTGVSAIVTRSKGEIDVLGASGRRGYAMRFLATGRLDPQVGHQGFERLRLRVVDAASDARGRDFVLGAVPGSEGDDVLRLGLRGRPDPRFGGLHGSSRAGVEFTTIEVQRGTHPVLFRRGFNEWGCRTYCPRAPNWFV